jgi:hypothetical protein
MDLKKGCYAKDRKGPQRKTFAQHSVMDLKRNYYAKLRKEKTFAQLSLFLSAT